MSELIIRISGDTSKFDDALEHARGETEGLEGKLATVAQVSAVAFAALSAEVFLSAKAFADASEKAAELNLAMQNQGIYSKELEDRYNGIADAISRKTGLDDDDIKGALATTQALIGQREISEGLAGAIVDLAAAKKIDLDTSAELISKGINGQTAALQKLGIVVDASLPAREREAKILEQITLRYGAAGEIANKSQFGIKAMQTAFGNLQEEIGQRLAPVLTAIIGGITRLFTALKENKPLLDLIFSVGAAATVITGLVTGAAAASVALLQLRAAMIAFGIATNTSALAVKGLVAATGLGLLLVIATEIYLNWNTIWPRTVAVFNAAAKNITDVAAGVGKILVGAFVLRDISAIKAGYEQVAKALKEGFTADITGPVEKQNAKLKEFADAAARDTAAAEARKQAIISAQRELAVLEAEGAAKAVIDLKKQEIEILTQLEDERYAAVRDQLEERLLELSILQSNAQEQAAEQRRLYQELEIQDTEEYRALTVESQAQFQLTQQEQLEQSILTEEQVRQDALKKRAQTQIAANNKFLADQQQFGTAYALINRIMHSEIYNGTKQAFGELAALQQSSNATLKAIGKAAAVVNIGIKTAESAMNVYAGFSTIPIIGQALGIAAAAAAVAFGGEQIGKVLAAAEGGLVTGGIPGIDSVPVLAQQGELIAPAENFDEVIGSVRAAREARNLVGEPGAGDGDGDDVLGVVELHLVGDFGQAVEASIVKRQRLGISVLKRIT